MRRLRVCARKRSGRCDGSRTARPALGSHQRADGGRSSSLMEKLSVSASFAASLLIWPAMRSTSRVRVGVRVSRVIRRRAGWRGQRGVAILRFRGPVESLRVCARAAILGASSLVTRRVLCLGRSLCSTWKATSKDAIRAKRTPRRRSPPCISTSKMFLPTERRRKHVLRKPQVPSLAAESTERL